MMDADIKLERGGDASLPSWMDPEERGWVYGQGVAYSLKWLDDLARGIGAIPLRRFVGEDHEWFAPSDALGSVIALLLRVAQEEEGASVNYPGRRSVDRETLIFDLTAYFAILSAAHERGDRFRICIG